jgi:hypothetical protein
MQTNNKQSASGNAASDTGTFKHQQGSVFHQAWSKPRVIRRLFITMTVVLYLLCASFQSPVDETTIVIKPVTTTLTETTPQTAYVTVTPTPTGNDAGMEKPKTKWLYLPVEQPKEEEDDPGFERMLRAVDALLETL